MKTGIVIQARMGSTRLAGKVLRPLNGIPLLGHVVGRLATLESRAAVVVATSVNPDDDAIVEYCKEIEATCFRGSEQDVLSRYADCADRFSLAHVVRLTADNPFTDIEELDRLIELHLSADYDYSSSVGALPVGVGAEVFGADALRRSEREGKLPQHREHVNEYILEHPALFRMAKLLDVPAAKRRPDVRLTVDTEADYRRASYIAERASGKWASTVEAIELCSHSA